MLGIAVCGTGNWGKNLVRNFASQADARLKYVCDLDEHVRQTMARLYSDSVVTDSFERALADPEVDAVAIAADAPHHYRLGKMALEAGKHAFVEKPLTLCASDSEELIQIAERKKLTLMVGHLLEYHPAVNYMKDMVTKGEINPHYAYFQRVNLGIVRRAENAWWSLAPHDISVACYLFDAEPVRVTASGQSYLQPGIEDVVFASLTFGDGRMAHIHVSWLDPHKMRKVTLVGAKKMVVFDDMSAAEKVRIYDKGADVKHDVDNYADAITMRTGDILIPKVQGGEPLGMECKHFIDSILNSTTPRSDGHDGLRVVRALEAGSRSLALGGVPIDLVTCEPVDTTEQPVLVPTISSGEAVVRSGKA